MVKSDLINDLAAALAKAQGDMKGALKDSSNPFYKSKYSDLASVFHAIGQPFAKNGLSVVQTTSESEKGTVLHTSLIHSSGQFITGEILVKPVKADPQGFGSALTYYRRYALASIAGVYSEDDDGNLASGKSVPVKAPSGALSAVMDFSSGGYDPKEYFEAFPPDDVPEVRAADLFPGMEKVPTTKDRVFSVGKNKGKKFSAVTDPDYMHWVKSQVEHDFAKSHPDLKDYYAFWKERGVVK